MLLKELKKDMMLAIKNDNKTKKNTLAVVIGEIDNSGKIKDLMNQNLSQEQLELKESEIVLSFLSSTYKKLKKSKEDFEGKTDNKSIDFINNVNEEMEIISSYLPKQLNFEELKTIILQFISENSVNISEKSSTGFIMKYLKDNFSGQYDGKMASLIINDLK